MSDVIGFLESVGRDASLRYATPETLEDRLRDARLDVGIRDAILAGDRNQLGALLGCQELYCMVAPGEEDDDEDQDDPDAPSTPAASRWARIR